MERIKPILIALLSVACLLGSVSLRAADPSTQPAAMPMGAPGAAPDNTPPAKAPENSSVDNTHGSRRTRNRGSYVDAMTMNPRPGSDPFAVLKTRSIFVKGNQTLASETRPGGTGGLSGTGTPSGPLVNHPEASLVFNGVTLEGDQAQALIEDLSSHKVSTLRTGDGIASGKVSAITLDDLIYEANGVAKHISLGENLDGVAQSSTGTSSVATDGSAPGGPPGPGTGASTPPSGGIPSGASPEDILARLRAKRNQELGIK